MTRLAVDLERLADLIDAMQRFEMHLTQARAQVDARVRRMQVVWTGESAAAQASGHQRWDAGAAEVHEALAVLRSVASTAHENYRAAMLANRRMWSL